MNSRVDFTRTTKWPSVPAYIIGNQLCQIGAKASSDGAGSHPMKRVNVGVVASNASNASSDAKDFSNKRCDDSDTELRSMANSIRSVPSRHSPMSPSGHIASVIAVQRHVR